MVWGGGVFTLHLYCIKHSVIPNWGKNTNDEELLHTFVYSRMPRPIAHRFNDSCLLKPKIILLMLAEEEHKITTSPQNVK